MNYWSSNIHVHIQKTLTIVVYIAMFPQEWLTVLQLYVPGIYLAFMFFCFQHNYIFINTDKLYFEFGIFLLLVKTFCWYLKFFLVKGLSFYVFITNILFWLKHQTKDWFTMRWWRFKGLYNYIIVILLLYC